VYLVLSSPARHFCYAVVLGESTMRRIRGMTVLVGSLASCYGWTPNEGEIRDAHPRDGSAETHDAGDDADAPDNAADGACLVPDRDHDGEPSLACGGDDCDDDDPLIHPGAPDNAGRWAFHDACSGDGFAVTAAGVAHFLCYAGPLSPYHAVWLDGDWVAEPVFSDPVPIVNEQDLALAPDATPHAAFVEISGEERGTDTLVHAVRGADGTWSSEVVATAAGIWSLAGHVAIDASGAVQLAVVTMDSARTERLRYATNASGRWLLEDILPGEAAPIAFAFAVEPSGRPHLLCTVSEFDGNVLYHVVRADDGWVREVVPARSGPGAVHLACDAAGTTHMLFDSLDGTPYGSDAGGTWRFEALEPGGSQLGADLALGPDGAPHVAYLVLGWDFAYDLRYARRTPSGWVREEVQAELPTWSPRAVVLGIDDSGAAHLRYVDTYATNAAGTAADGLDQDCDGIDG
jgi:hypothetical protein